LRILHTSRQALYVSYLCALVQLLSFQVYEALRPTGRWGHTVYATRGTRLREEPTPLILLIYMAFSNPEIAHSFLLDGCCLRELSTEASCTVLYFVTYIVEVMRILYHV